MKFGWNVRELLLLCLIARAARSQGVLEYDDPDSDTPDTQAANGKDKTLGARSHRPSTGASDSYTANRYVQPPLTGRNTYRNRPTAAPARGRQEEQKVVQPDSGGCTHASETMGVLCPNGCELMRALEKQQRVTKEALDTLKPEVDDLSRSSNTISDYVKRMSNAVRERQLVINDNNKVVSQYTDSLEEQHAYIKETVDTAFPSNIKILQGTMETIRQKILKLEKAIQVQNEACKEPCLTSCPIPVVSGKECEDVFRRGGVDSQMYMIQPDPLYAPYKVFCDQQTQRGGWLLIQNRMDGSVDFGRRWDDYRQGFGNIAFDIGKGHCQTPGEYWLGNERISKLSKAGPTEVLIEMQDWSGDKVNAHYQQFTIQSETSNYIMSVDGYSGNAGNAFLEGATQLHGENRTMTIHNGMMFSTYDRDNDKWIPGDPSKQCAREDGGGWWYNRCHSANPNGRYYIGGAYTRNMAKHGTDDGMVWMNWKGSWHSLKAISMKIRPFFASN